jgi:hypothetical protein
MVSRKRLILIAAGSLFATLACCLSAADLTRPSGRKFYPDDPIWREPAPRAVTKVAVRKVDDLYDFVANSYVTPGREGKSGRLTTRSALDINTVGEVPDGPWYTNRHWLRRMSIAELQRGPGNETPPDRAARWKVVAAKSDGVTPGFVIEDARGNRYLLKFDPPDAPELCSAADVVGSKFFYALGYYTPENYIVRFRSEALAIDGAVTWKDAQGRQHPLTHSAIARLLKRQPKAADGTYRALASRWIGGKVVGPFSYRGTRSDDPNDTIPHEDRRVLRGLAVFCAWLNHHDTRSINSMDTLVTENGRQYLKHYLMDFGSILGSAGYGPKEPWVGHQYYISRRDAVVQTVTFGFYAPRWMRSDYPRLRGVGRLDSWSFDPPAWKSNYPNPAFLMMDSNDAFWAAKQVATFSDAEIRAIVATGELSDPKAADWIARCLIERRNRIAQAWYSRALPLDRFRIADGRLAFDDLGAALPLPAGQSYDVRWSAFDNETGQLAAIAGASGTKLPALGRNAEHVAADVTCSGSPDSCPESIRVYLRRGDSAWNVVGVDRYQNRKQP